MVWIWITSYIQSTQPGIIRYNIYWCKQLLLCIYVVCSYNRTGVNNSTTIPSTQSNGHFLDVPGCSRFITNIGLSVGIPTPTDHSGISTDKINETQLIKLMFKKEYVFIWQKGTPGRSTFVKPTLQNEWLRKYWQTGRVGVDWLASCEPDEHTEIFIMSFIFRYYPSLKFTTQPLALSCCFNVTINLEFI